LVDNNKEKIYMCAFSSGNVENRVVA